jgi:hypothetical protein
MTPSVRNLVSFLKMKLYCPKVKTACPNDNKNQMEQYLFS